MVAALLSLVRTRPAFPGAAARDACITESLEG